MSPARSPRRIVEFAEDVAGPACGRIFAALGDTVMKLETPDGDLLRRRRPFDESGSSLAFTALNSGKSSLRLDAIADEKIYDLLGGADVFIVDLPEDEALRRRFDPSAIRARWPDVVVVSITPFGLGNDRSAEWGDSLFAEAYGGLATMVGDPHERPLSLGGEQAAFAAAFAGFLGATVALARRQRGGDGEIVDVALCDVAAYIDWKSDIVLDETGSLPWRVGPSTGRWRIVEARDGYVGVIYMPEQWSAMCQLVGDARLADARFADPESRDRNSDDLWPIIQAWAAPLDCDEIYHRAQALGLPFGYTAGASRLVKSPQYVSRGFIVPAEVRRSGHPVVGSPFTSNILEWRTGDIQALGAGRPPRWSRPASRPGAGDGTAPLEGLRVLDFGTITAGAATSRLLADFGASVVKVESTEHPDPFRQWIVPDAPPLRPGDSSPVFESNNAGKLSVSLDLTSREDRRRLHELVTEADVLVENFRVGVTEKLGIDYDTVHAINPQLIYLSLSSQGRSGPEATYRSYGSTLDLMSGLAEVTGYVGGGPVWSSAEINYPDQLVSLLAAGLIAYCLQGGLSGGYIDLAQREVVSWTLSTDIAHHVLTGAPFKRSGNRRPGLVPHEVYPTADGAWIAIACPTDRQRQDLATLIAFTEGRHRGPGWWDRNQDSVDRAVAAWTSERNANEAEALLRGAEIPCVPVLDANRRRSEPRFVGRRVFLPGPPRIKGFPFVTHNYDIPVPSAAPGLGAYSVDHIDSVWRSVGTDDAQSPTAA